MDPFTFKLLLVFILIVLQGILWGWVGSQAREKISWWPKDE
jgi:hypothetical protein